MDTAKAKEFLGVGDGFTQLELVQSYKSLVDGAHTEMENTNEHETICILANKLYDFSRAYLALRDNEIEDEKSLTTQQPLVIFTDASVHRDHKKAAFGIVTENINMDFSLPTHTIEKYNIHEESGTSPEKCILTGIVKNFDVDATEIVAILAALEIFQFLVSETDQKVVFYTDSLTAKKVLTDNRLPSGTKVYSDFRDRFKKIVEVNNIEVVIKKIEAHAGHEMNEIADSVAKNRCVLEN